ncbi:MoaD/ThiS family protein [Leptospira yanagawae]|uniref:MoaD/ThiS family protein n=1 Tax=Leptospira yanagawae TaxID=293069 RepID=A0ABY2M3J0_9LEPT|nr:MoaD/ThiS family protein [Leptospira yanagawae]TGL19934.1 MoaD/ThiS family protein [Leptospira yanagawae]
MEVEILYFAALKDYFPNKQQREIERETSVSTLIEILIKENPDAAKILKVCRVSINQKMAKESDTIPKNASIAILPPSSGG